MKNKITDKTLTELQPGVISDTGFMSSDKRNTEKIIADDAVIVTKLGVTNKSIAKRMRELARIGEKGLGQTVRHGDLEISVDSSRGKIPCPFMNDEFLPKNNTTVKNLKTGKEITYSDLNIHMIEKHGFYEGKGSVYRIDPATLWQIIG